MAIEFHPIRDMIESAKAQHEVDRASFAAARAESKARFEEARAMGRPSTHRAAMQRERERNIEAANERIAAAKGMRRD